MYLLASTKENRFKPLWQYISYTRSSAVEIIGELIMGASARCGLVNPPLPRPGLRFASRQEAACKISITTCISASS
jgi:hypothetical protein